MAMNYLSKNPSILVDSADAIREIGRTLAYDDDESLRKTADSILSQLRELVKTDNMITLIDKYYVKAKEEAERIAAKEAKKKEEAKSCEKAAL